MAFVSPSRKVGEMSLSGPPHYRAFFEELSRLGYVRVRLPRSRSLSRSTRASGLTNAGQHADRDGGGLLHRGLPTL